jgi:hypothetical protein
MRGVRPQPSRHPQLDDVLYETKAARQVIERIGPIIHISKLGLVLHTLCSNADVHTIKEDRGPSLSLRQRVRLRGVQDHGSPDSLVHPYTPNPNANRIAFANSGIVQDPLETSFASCLPVQCVCVHERRIKECKQSVPI